MGGYTTYSSFNFETLRLAEDGSYGLAALNMGLSLSAQGMLSGTPTAAGQFPITLEAVDAVSRSAPLFPTIVRVSLARAAASFTDTGSMKIARRPQDGDVIKADFERGRRMRLDVELVTPEQASRLNPFLKPTGVVAAMRVGDDRYFDPAQFAVGYARAAVAGGTTLLPKTDVLAVNISAGKVTGVTTAKGTIEGPIVVDAAGAWTRQVAEACGIRVPLVPTRQQLIVTEPLDGVHANLPMVRIMDAAVYMRPCEGGLLWGVYEEAPRFFEMQSLAVNFDIKDMPLDIEVLRSAAAEVKDQLPILQTAQVRELRGGIPTMTADGHHILGPAPGVEGFYFASGCNVAGLSISPTVGEALAAWIVDGKPPVDLSPMSCMRFKDKSWSEAQLQRDAAWQYRHFYGAV